MNIEQLKQEIRDNIKVNGKGYITGQILQDVLIDMATKIGDAEEMYETGFEEYFFGKGVCLVEWADLFPELMPEGTVWIKISKDPEKGFDYRLIEIDSRDED